MRLTLSHQKTVGSGACDGCGAKLCLGVGIINLVSPAGPTENIQMLGFSDLGGSSATVTWQGATVFDFNNVFERTGIFSSFNCSSSGPDPTRSSTWGAVKSLYR